MKSFKSVSQSRKGAKGAKEKRKKNLFFGQLCLEPGGRPYTADGPCSGRYPTSGLDCTLPVEGVIPTYGSKKLSFPLRPSRLCDFARGFSTAMFDSTRMMIMPVSHIHAREAV